MLVLLLPQLHPEGSTPAARGPQRRAEGRPKGEAGSIQQLPLHVVVHVGEGLAGGEVGHPAPGGQAATGARAQHHVPVAGVLGQVELSSGPGRLMVTPLCSTHRQNLLANAQLHMVVRSDGGDLDTWAVKGSGVHLGPVLEPLGLIANGLVVVCGGETCRVTVQLLEDRLLGQSLCGGGRCPHIQIWTCEV